MNKAKRLLLVEDNILIATIEKKQLEKEGYKVITAFSAREAIDTVNSCKSSIDLILMDIDLGNGMDGTDATIEILKDHEIPVVFLSSHTEKEIVQKTEKITSYGYVVKNSGIIVLDASIKMAFRLFESRIKVSEKKLALQESREIFRNMSDKAIVGVYMIQDNIFHYVNSMIAGILGYSTDELIYRMGPEDFIFDEDWPLVKKNLEGRISGKQLSNQYDFRIRRKDGNIRNVEVCSSRTISNGKPAVIGTLIDITERKAAENELRRVNERLRLITENMSEGVILTDMNMHIEYITPSVTDSYGFTLEDLNKIPLEKRMTGESYNRLKSIISEKLTPENLTDAAKDISVVTDLEYYRKDGSTCWSASSFRLIRDDRGSPAGILCVERDITQRKHIENALKESEERFRSLSEGIPGYICSCLPDGTMTYVNPALALTTGMEPENMTGKNFLDFLDPDEIDVVKKHLQYLTPDNPVESHEQSHVNPDKSISYQQWRNRAFFDENGKVSHYLSVGIDTTERKNTEEKLRQHTIAMEAAIDGIAILNADHKYIYLNRAHAEIYGYAGADELLGKSWQILYNEDELQRFANDIMPQFMYCGYFNGNATGMKKDGSLFDQEVSLTALDNGGLICIVRDITERKKIENALREGEKKYRLLIDHSSDLIWELTEDGIFTYVSPSWLRVTGYEPSSVIGISFRELVHTEDIPYCVEYLEEIIRSREVLSSPEYRVRHADGTWHWHAATGTPVIGTGGEFLSMVGVSRDITGKKLADDRIRTLLKEKELFLREVHHRVKNNMNTIFGLLMIQADVCVDSEAKNIILDSASRVQSMMILYDRLYRSEIKAAVPVKEYFTSLINEITTIFPHRETVKIITEIEDFILDAAILSPIGIIINELVTNTMKYAFTSRDSGCIIMKASKNGRKAIIIFQDNGNGIPETVKLETSSGFGLQLVSMLVKQLKGTVIIERTSGTKFTIEFEV